jgi:hypothetical protein
MRYGEFIASHSNVNFVLMDAVPLILMEETCCAAIKCAMPAKTISQAITRLTATAARSIDPASMPETISETPYHIDRVEARQTISAGAL